MDAVGQGFLSVNGMRKVARLGLCSLILILGACGGGYQAPLDDRSSTLERSGPLIVVDGQTMPSSSRPAPAASAPASTPATTAPVGSAATVVRPVAVGSGISRSVTRSELPPASAVEPTTANPTTANPTTANPTTANPTTANPTGAPVTQTPATVPSSGNVSTGNSSGTASLPSAVTPSGAVHVVAQGDTLYSIAFAHNIDVRSLALVNNLAAPYTIFPGQRLNLSAGGVSAAAINAVPQIPAAPAGESAPASGQRPQAAIDARRTGSVNTRQVEGVSWQWPADGRLLSTFSESGAARGIDIAGTQGQAVFAAADGDVVYAGRGIPGAGNLLILRHSERHLSAYMHNSSMLVAEGDNVRAGDKIAEIGTGPSGRDLLHFEVRVDGKPVDPVRYLPNR